MAKDIVMSSPPKPALLRKYRQPIYDEERIGNNAATQTLRFFTRPIGQADASAAAKTARDTNLNMAGQLGGKGEMYLVGFTANLDWQVMVLDTMTAAPGAQNCEMYAAEQIMNDSLFRFWFGRTAAQVEVPFDRIPTGMAPYGAISTTRADGAAEVASIMSNGLPTTKEFYDIRLDKGIPHHIEPQQAFNCEITWPNGAITIGTTSGAEWYRIMVYMIGMMMWSL